LADRCEIQLAYAIGVARPVSVNVDTSAQIKLTKNLFQNSSVKILTCVLREL